MMAAMGTKPQARCRKPFQRLPRGHNSPQRYGYVKQPEGGDSAATGPDKGDGPTPAYLVSDVTPEEIGDHVGGEHDAENLKPLLEREADYLDEEDGQKDQNRTRMWW